MCRTAGHDASGSFKLVMLWAPQKSMLGPPLRVHFLCVSVVVALFGCVHLLRPPHVIAAGVPSMCVYCCVAHGSAEKIQKILKTNSRRIQKRCLRGRKDPIELQGPTGHGQCCRGTHYTALLPPFGSGCPLLGGQRAGRRVGFSHCNSGEDPFWVKLKLGKSGGGFPSCMF